MRPEGGWLGEAVLLILRLFGRLANLETAIEAYTAGAQRQAQLIVTEAMMTIELPPHRRLRLGDDLTANFPPALRQISNPDLLELLSVVDPTPDSTLESGAQYWGDLPDRIHFIADMFRCYQMSTELLEPPFTAEQTAMLKEGRIPPGRL